MNKDNSRAATLQATTLAYLAMARLDHSTKQIFIIPGIMLAYLLRGVHMESLGVSIGLGLMTAICVASANYVINEWLDREFDKFHPTKASRSAVQNQLEVNIVLIEWATLLTIGLACAFANSRSMFMFASIFAIQGIVYNVPPFRTKDRAYLDVISESINNPLRLMIGWAMVDPTTLPPSSVILTYWAGGAFLMAAKRFSEFREIVASHGRELLERYRASFVGYSEKSLAVSCLVYALCAVFFLAIFLIKYRIEYLLTVPIIIALFAKYLALSMEAGSSAQKPEKLFRENGLMVLVALLAAVFLATTFINIPQLEVFTSQRYIEVQ
ncbi:MAG TPA: UbiA family prenyltransferase [Candidatus Acidoferrales bacterium]|nr:UbiA family prenyltransferase [Candidatus Acidoferrales bacterium]